MSTTSIIIQSLAAAFIISNWLVDEVKRAMLRLIEWKANKQKAKVPKDDKWGDVVGFINSNLASLQRDIIEAKFKPFSCMQCMTFWLSIITATCTGSSLQDIMFVGIVGFACGMLLDRILMRWL